MALLEFKNVCFKYKNSESYSLDNINISLNEGQIVGLLGPNGSGKTTIIKMIAGLLKNYQGEILIDGKSIGVESKNLVSYLPDSTYLDETCIIKDIIKMFKDYYADFDENKMFNMLNSMNISKETVIKTLSKGNKEKLQLALVLSRNAKIYLLDEPIGGVDPVQRDFIINTILNNYAKDSLVIISTHLIDEIDEILNRAIFLKVGKIVLDDTKANIINTHDGKNLNEVFKEVFRIC